MKKLISIASAVMRVPLWAAIPGAIGVLVASVFLAEAMGMQSDWVLLLFWALVLYFCARAYRYVSGKGEPVKTRAILIVLAIVHVLGLVSYFTLPLGYQKGQRLYEEMLDVEFWVFPAIFAAGWALISVLLLLRRRAFDGAGATKTPAWLAIGICIVLALFAAGGVGVAPAGTELFSSFGADLPAPTLMARDGYLAWAILLVLGIVLAGIVALASDRHRERARLAFSGMIGLLVVANIALPATLGAMFLPFFSCGGLPENATYTRLHAAALLGHQDSILRLIARGTPVDVTDDDGATPLYVAVESSHLAAAQSLVAKGANVNAVDVVGTAPLHAAVARGRSDVATWLLDNGAQVNSPKHIKRSPLHIAAGRDSADLAALLLAKGADVNAEDSQGKTPLDWASTNKQSQVAQLLVKHGGVRSTEESRRLKTARPVTQQARAGSSHSCGEV